MKKDIGHIIQQLPISNIKKVADLIEYEGPILSHFIDGKGRNFFFYWVDRDETHNRWLIWRLSEEQLYKYLKGITSLKSVLLEPTKDFVFFADIDSNLNATNIRAIELEELVTDYIPENESFFSTEILPQYKFLLDKYETNLYLSHLRENSIYFTLEPKSLAFSTTISALDAGNFLRKISNSFLYFIEFDFYESFKTTISDVKRLKSIINQFKDILSPRVVDLKFSSFKVAISADTFKSVDNSEYKDWQRTILEKYKDDVIEVDYDSEVRINEIVTKYPETVRRNIYSPIIEIINDKKYNLNISDHKRRYVKTYKSIKKKNEEILIPKPLIIDDEGHEKRKLVNLIIELSDKEDITNLGKREIQHGLLFSQEIKKFPFGLKEIRFSNIFIDLKYPIICEFHLENNYYYISNIELEIEVKAENYNDAVIQFNKVFVELYLNLLDDNSELNKSIRDKLFSLIAQVRNNEK